MSGLFNDFEQFGGQKARKYLFITSVSICCALLVIISNEGEGSVLHLVAMILVMASTDSTTLAARAAFFVFGSSGTRLRNVQIACVVLSYLLSLLLEETLAVLLMVRLIRKVVDVLQQESIQALHQRELLRKTVARMPALAAQPGVREAILQQVQQDRSAESASSPDKVRGIPLAPAPGHHSPDKPASPAGGQASGSKSDDVPLVVPAMSLSISELLAVITLSEDDDVPMDSACSPSAQQKNSANHLPTDHGADEHENENSHSDTSLSTKPRCTTNSTASSKKWAAVQGMHSKRSDLEISSLNPEPFETAADTSSEKMSTYSSDSSLGKKCQRSVIGVPERSPLWTAAEATAAHQSRRTLWRRVLSKMSHHAGAAFAPLQSLMAKLSGSSEFNAATVLGDSAITEVSATSPPALLRGPMPKSAILCESRKGAGKTATLLEHGKIFLPGESSPPKKQGQEKR
ncbi:hypothetical protein V5799_025472, partial [Amblyomma americanum]